ncbi:patatin-like phospholipase family protein [Amaricoccus sp.]|uniref:patatin-like phospholipase family protein n=1 Tax=Amaricoccus sp. TaxID=1872485 RepID=UPI001B79F8A8|nr:patatin-like phospholipase family protein [Amaricoccus sp.]MBP7003075.1 patatin-like phospholipase family protein [Amaricoccus sp.]
METKRQGARKRVNLALQGGGSHGALTWGVLDRLLEDGRLQISAISGTSAGAMNAVVLADGYERDGPAGARAALARFWKAVSDAARFSPIQRSLWDRMSGRYSLDRSPGYLFMESLSRVFSPYDLNPTNVNPLRDLLEKHVDFDNVNRRRAVQVFVTATNVRTGRPRIFGQGDVTVDSVLASACLPQMFPAVEIGGEHYWDGGYAGNPALYPLIDNRASQDIVVVQINPIDRPKLPRSAREIINRVNEISFNTSLIKELRAIALTQRLADEGGLDLGHRRTFLHIIHTEEEVEDLAASSKLNAEWDYLRMLFERGRGWADAWLAAHFDDIGLRSTLDLEEIFEDAPRPALPPVADPEEEA